MNPDNNINDKLDDALRRLGEPPGAAMEAASERVRQAMKTANVSADASEPVLDATPAGLWRLRGPFLMAGLVIAMLLSALAVAFREQPAPLSPNALAWPIPDGPGKAVVQRACTECHTLEGIENHVYDNPEQYRSLIFSMMNMHGAILSDEEITAVTEYLWETYGRQ